MILTEKVNLFYRVNAVSWGTGSQKVVGHQNKHFKWKCLFEEKFIVNIFQTFFEQLVKQLLSEQAELRGGSTKILVWYIEALKVFFVTWAEMSTRWSEYKTDILHIKHWVWLDFISLLYFFWPSAPVKDPCASIAVGLVLRLVNVENLWSLCGN